MTTRPVPVQGDRRGPAPAMFGRVIGKEDAVGLRELLIDYRILTLHLPEKPKIHIATGRRSLTLGVQIVSHQ